MGASSSQLRFASLFTLLSLVSLAPEALAQGTNGALAETLFREGKQLMAQGKYAEACPKIAESQHLDPGAGTLLNLAACHEAGGMIATAWAEFGEAASQSRRDGRADREQFALEHARALEPKIPRLTIEVADGVQALTSLDVQVDGISLGRVAWSVPAPVDPGTHVVTATAKDKKPFRAEVVVAAGPDTQKVAIPLLEDAPHEQAPEASRPGAPGSPGAPGPDTTQGSGSSQKIWGFAAGGVGIAALGVGTYFGLHAFSKWSERNDHCKGGCDQTAVDASDAAHSSARMADILVGVGIVGVGVGTFLVLAAPSANDGATAGSWVSVGSVARGAPGVSAGGVW